MSNRNVGFSTKEAVVSIMGAFRDRQVEDGVAEKRARSRTTAVSVPVANLPEEMSLHEIVGETEISVETTGWRLGAIEQAALNRARGQRAFSVRSGEGKGEFIILVDPQSASVVSVVSRLDASAYITASAHVGRALTSCGISIDGNLHRFSAVKDKDGHLHFLDACPDRLELSQNTYVHSRDTVLLPKVLVATGDFDLIDSPVGRNMVSASVGGSLELRNLTGLVVPSHLNVGLDLSLQLSDCDRLPMRFSVGRDLDIGLTRITEFPDTFHVGRNIKANGSAIRRLKVGFVVSGNLDLRDCPIAELPWGLDIAGDLNLSGTPIASVPADASIGGNLLVEEGVVVPSTVKIGGSLMFSRPYGYETARPFAA